VATGARFGIDFGIIGRSPSAESGNDIRYRCEENNYASLYSRNGFEPKLPLKGLKVALAAEVFMNGQN
jgi:hypothetical protein